MAFFGITVNFMTQKLKSNQLICLSFLWWHVLLREREKIFYAYSRPKTALNTDALFFMNFFFQEGKSVLNCHTVVVLEAWPPTKTGPPASVQRRVPRPLQRRQRLAAWPAGQRPAAWHLVTLWSQILLPFPPQLGLIFVINLPILHHQGQKGKKLQKNAKFYG